MWLGNSQKVLGNSAGAMNGDGSRKLLLHSTEGSTVEGAVAAYRQNNSWPHLTVDCPRRRIVQHLPLDVAARSLRNTSAAGETNREGTVLVQIEMVGTATRPTTLGSPEDLVWFAERVVQPICKWGRIPIASTVRWVSYPASYGLGAKQRLTTAAWDAYSGILGHQHAPENTHGDPGSIDIGWIIQHATEEEDDMTLDQLIEALEGKGPDKRLRGVFKGLIQGSGLDALREHEKEDDERGAWRGQIKATVKEVLDEREAG